MVSSRDHERAEEVFQQLFFTPEGRTNPYPLYHQLRDADPVHKTGAGMWLLSRYDDCWATLRDPRFGKDYTSQMEQRFGPDWRTHSSLTRGEHSMLNIGGPEHTRLRRLVSKAFTPRMIERLKPVIAKTVEELLDPIADAAGGNILEAVGFPLPVTIIGEMLGVPEPDRNRFRALVRDLVGVLEMKATPEQIAAANAAEDYIKSYFLDLLDEKRKKPGEDLLSSLVLLEVGGDRLSDDELVTLASLLFAAGFETATNLFGNGLYGLLQQPDQIDLLRNDPSLFAALSEEILRYDGTAQMVNRVTEATVEVGGVAIPAGEQVFTLLGAANHDPARYENPDRIDVTRKDIAPLSFGGGVHFCLGAALARAEMGIVFRTLFDRFESIELTETPHFEDRLTLRGLESLNVRCKQRPGWQAGIPPEEGKSPESVESPAAQRSAAAERGLRPSAADTTADLQWRAEMRGRIENEPTREDSIPVRTGRRLAATVELLSRNGLFKPCSKAELEELAATAYPMSFEPGDLLCVEGAESPESYMIQEGQAVVTIGRKGVGTVGEDDIVGERGVLLETTRAATVTAITHMITYAISRERFRALVDRNPTVRDWMLAEMERRYPQPGKGR